MNKIINMSYEILNTVETGSHGSKIKCMNLQTSASYPVYVFLIT
jgi:hypothetical protein